MKRAAVVLLGIAVLSAWGMPFHPPCCGFRGSSQISVASNCCPIEGCPLAQARGAAPASIVAVNSLGDPVFPSLAGLTFASQLTGITSVANGPLPDPGTSPPRPHATTPAFLSIFRI